MTNPTLTHRPKVCIGMILLQPPNHTFAFVFSPLIWYLWDTTRDDSNLPECFAAFRGVEAVTPFLDQLVNLLGCIHNQFPRTLKASNLLQYSLIRKLEILPDG